VRCRATERRPEEGAEELLEWAVRVGVMVGLLVARFTMTPMLNPDGNRVVGAG
jgi:hypothetical protein